MTTQVQYTPSPIPTFAGRAAVTDPSYGALGNGSNDDSAAIQLALAANAVTELPNGTYSVRSTLLRTLATHLRGNGAAFSKLNWAGAGGANPIMTCTPGGVNTDTGSLSRLAMSGGNVATYCLSLSGLVALTLDEVQLSNAVNACLFLNNVNGMSARDCLFQGGTTTSQIVLAAGSGGGSNDMTWDNCSFAAHNACQGLQIQPGDTVHVVSGCNFEGNSIGASAIISAGVASLLVEECFFENWANGCIAATSGTTQNITVLGCNMAALSSATACIQLNGTLGRVSIRDVFFNTLGNGGQCATGIRIPTTVTDVEILGCRQPSGNTGTIISIAGTAYPYSDLVISKDIPTEWKGIGAPSAQGAGSGQPYGISPKAGDTYDRQDTLTVANQRRYLCTVGGATPTWVAIY